MTKLRRILYVFWQWIWGLPQNIAGATLYLYFRLRGCPHYKYKGSLVTIWPLKSGSMSMGRFLFMHPTWTPDDQRLLNHEYGHTVQSLILGPLFLPIIGLPSILWAGLPYYQKLRKRKNLSYYDAYQEKWANTLGDRFAKDRLELQPKPPRKPRKPRNAPAEAQEAEV